MLYVDEFVGFIILGLWIFCLIDAITTDESLCRNLGKVMWIVLIVFLPLVGSVAWLVAGRPEAARPMPYKGNYGPVVSDRQIQFAAIDIYLGPNIFGICHSAFVIWGPAA